jgi:Lon protease-like protein
LTLSSLPLFPLGTVLFPGGVLPLQIFEVRYLDMIGKCVKTGAPFGVVALTQGNEVRQPGAQTEGFASVGTLATVTSCDASHPGLMVIRASGAQRFRVEASNQLKHGLWLADVKRVPDDPHVAVPADLQPAANALGKLIASLQLRQLSAQQMPVQAPYQLDDCAWVANRWCELLPLPLEMKQRLMALDNALVRLELVGDILERHRLL